jgi:hypothetical protein
LRLLLALSGLIATSSFAEPLDTVRECATTAAPTLNGLKELAAVCPDLRAALGALGFDKILYEGWQDKLNVHALRDLIDLNAHYTGRRFPGVPDTSALPGILKALQAEQAPQGLSWWRSFKNWLKEWLEHSDSSIAKWLKQLMERTLGAADLSSGAVQAFVYIVTALTALAALVIIGRELNSAGIALRFRRSRSRDSAENSLSPPPIDDESPTDESSPGGALRALVRRLLQTGRLTTERGLTHRQLIACARFDDEGQRTVFARVARAAEALLYGSEPAKPEILQAVTRQGRELLQQLSRAANQP